MNVLIVDDDPIICTVLTEALNKLGVANVLTAEDGREAAQLFTRHEIGLIFLDLNMPNSDGIEFISFLADRRSNPSVAFVTGAHDVIRRGAETLARTSKIHVVETLRKPVNFSRVAEALAKAEEHHSVHYEKAAT